MPKAFVVYPTYRVENNKAFVYLFGKMETGESFLTINEFVPYFYIKQSDLPKTRQLFTLNTEQPSPEKKDFAGNALVRINLAVPAEVPPLRDKLEDHGITTYEADIRFPYRFMIDKGIKGSMVIKGTSTKGTFVDRVYKNPDFAPATWTPKLKVLSLDIETDPQAKEIYSISLVTDKYEKVLIRSTKKLDKAISYDSERELLEGFKNKIQQLDPDIITGWNLIDFDLKILEKRCKHYKIPFMLGRADWESSLRIYRDFLRDSRAEIPGRMVLDGIHLLKSSFVRMEEYTLDHVSQQVLGENKLIEKEGKGEKIVDYFKNNPQKLVDYNLKDSVLVQNILNKLGVVDLTIQRSLLTGMQLDRVSASVASLDSLYVREAGKHHIVCYNSRYNEKERPITGGYVRDSLPGLYQNIIVLDFKSLYPSIMRTFNIDPWSYVEMDAEQARKQPETFIVAPNGAVFHNREGFLPRIIQELWQQREKARKQKNELARFAIKIHMNSFFGVLANPNCRFFSIAVSNAITHFAQYLIKLTAEKIEEQGYTVIYGDTDSVFVDAKLGSFSKAEALGKQLQAHINDFYVKFIQDTYHRKSFLELELDKVFKHFLMPKIRGSDKGAKKRYAGIVVKDDKDKLVFTGLESVRSDWTELSKQFQETLLWKIFQQEHYDQFIKQFVADLKQGKYDALLVYKKKINKPLAEYIKTTPPHVKAARKLSELKSNLIQYVMTTDGPEPVEAIKHDLDYDHYAEKQLKPVADSILSFMDTDFDTVVSKTKQLHLGEF